LKTISALLRPAVFDLKEDLDSSLRLEGDFERLAVKDVLNALKFKNFGCYFRSIIHTGSKNTPE